VRPALDADIIAQEIVEDLQAALAQFAEIASDLKRGASESKAEQGLTWSNASVHLKWIAFALWARLRDVRGYWTSKMFNVTAADAFPAERSWLGSVRNQRQCTLRVIADFFKKVFETVCRLGHKLSSSCNCGGLRLRLRLLKIWRNRMRMFTW
jgi:hypothetical protein